ncbi:hypothetical protein [Thalassoglobus neptunius]|nr:hypothetical protein [Thalassoglobus neptunius]
MIEFLIVMAVVSGVIAWLVKSVNTTGESRWVGLIVTLFGIQVVIGIGALVFYARSQSVNAARVEAEHQRALAAEQLSLEMSQLTTGFPGDESFDASNPPTPPMPETPQPPEDVAAAAEGSMASSSTGDHPATIIYQDVSVTRLGLLMTLGLFSIGVWVVVWGAKKSPSLMFAAVVGLLLSGAMFGISSTAVHQNVAMHEMHEMSSDDGSVQLATTGGAVQAEAVSSDPVIDGSFVRSQIPVTDDEVASLERKLEPKKIVRIEYTGLTGHSEILDEMPEWTANTSRNRQVVPVDDEILLTSKRYSTVDEAERELWPKATSLVQKYVRENSPEMDQTIVTKNALLDAAALKEVIIVTWPFEVDGLSSEVYQVHWKLNFDEGVRETLHQHWSRHEVAERLWLLGGGVGVLTLLLGTGATIARFRERRHVA